MLRSQVDKNSKIARNITDLRINRLIDITSSFCLKLRVTGLCSSKTGYNSALILAAFFNLLIWNTCGIFNIKEFKECFTTKCSSSFDGFSAPVFFAFVQPGIIIHHLHVDHIHMIKISIKNDNMCICRCFYQLILENILKWKIHSIFYNLYKVMLVYLHLGEKKTFY